MRIREQYPPFLYRPDTVNAYPLNDDKHGREVRAEIQSVRRRRKHAKFQRSLR